LASLPDGELLAPPHAVRIKVPAHSTIADLLFIWVDPYRGSFETIARQTG